MDAKRLGVVVLLLVLVIMLAAAKDLAKNAGYHATLYADNIEGATGDYVDNIKTYKIRLDDGGSYVDVYANGGTLCVNAPDMCKLDIKSCDASKTISGESDFTDKIACESAAALAYESCNSKCSKDIACNGDDTSLSNCGGAPTIVYYTHGYPTDCVLSRGFYKYDCACETNGALYLSESTGDRCI